MSGAAGRIRWHERSYALGSLACGLLLAAFLFGFAVRNLGFLALAVVGLGLTTAGGWWAITERMPRRAVGIVGAALGAAGIVVALVGATPSGDDVVLRLVVLAVLLAGAVGLGRAAAPLAVPRAAHMSISNVAIPAAFNAVAWNSPRPSTPSEP